MDWIRRGLWLGVFLSGCAGAMLDPPSVRETPDLGSVDGAVDLAPIAPPDAAPIAPPCPDGVVDPSTGHCYRFFDRTERSLMASQDKCATLGGHVVTLTSEPEAMRVTSLLQPDDRVWLGLVDLSRFRVFEWVSGERSGYTRWKPNEPNNGQGDEWCVWFDRQGMWDDDPCDETLLTLCEIAPF